MPDRVVFDSIANDPRVGNEVYFMGAKVLGSPGSMQRKVDVRVGDTVLVRALIENDAAMNAPDTKSLVARGTRFSLHIRRIARRNCRLSESYQRRMLRHGASMTESFCHQRDASPSNMTGDRPCSPIGHTRNCL